MRELVGILNQFLKIRTYASCGGHIKLSGRENPTPKGEFYVSFVLPTNDPEGVIENKISIIKAAIQVYGGKVVLENDHETSGFSIESGWCSWTINGKGVNPDDFAGTLFSKYLKFENANPSKQGFF